MAAKANSPLDELSWFTQTVGESPKLCLWLCGLERQSVAERRKDILLMIARMAGQKEDARLMASLGLLAESSVFNAVLVVLRESGKIDSKSPAAC